MTGGTESAFRISFCLHRLRKEGAMGILLDEPKYPVIDRAPSAGTTISNFNLADWLRVTAITSASIPVGYLAGAITSCVSVFPLVFLVPLVSHGFLLYSWSGNLLPKSRVTFSRLKLDKDFDHIHVTSSNGN